MEPGKLAELVQQAARDGVTSSLWILILTALLAAAIGAIFGSYLKKKGENIATNEQFRESLKQAFEQTQIVEQVKARITTSSQESMESFKVSLGREFEKFKAEMQNEIKRESELFTFRYSKIYGALEQITNLPILNCSYLKRVNGKIVEDRDMFKEVLHNVFERFGIVIRIYDRIELLLDSDVRVSMENYRAEHERLFDILTSVAREGKTFPEGVDNIKVMEFHSLAEARVAEILTKQLGRLTKFDSEIADGK